MASRQADRLAAELEKKRTLVEGLADRAADENRDLSDDEMTTIESVNTESVTLRRQLDLLTQDLGIDSNTADKLRSMGNSLITGEFKYRSSGELLWDVLHQHDADARKRYARAMQHARAAEHMGTDAATTTPVAGDLGGLIVKPVVGPVSNPYPKGMPLANAIGMQQIPTTDGFGFSRPHIVDPGFTTGVAVQTLEKAELASRAFSIEVDNVPLQTIGGYLNVSLQLQSFQPSSLDIIVGQLRRRLENAVDVTMATELQASTGYVALVAGATAAQIIAAIYQAAGAYYAVTYQLPTTVVMGPLGWVKLGSTTDLAGRPLFPTLGAANAPGSASATSFAVTVAGLTPVVTPSITDDALYVTGPDALEGFLYQYPVLESVEASVLGKQVAVAASVAGFRPTPFANATIKIAATP